MLPCRCVCLYVCISPVTKGNNAEFGDLPNAGQLSLKPFNSMKAYRLKREDSILSVKREKTETQPICSRYPFLCATRVSLLGMRLLPDSLWNTNKNYTFMGFVATPMGDRSSRPHHLTESFEVFVLTQHSPLFLALHLVLQQTYLYYIQRPSSIL